ncbi:MAG: DUF6089 family protein [Cytophagaceae bacterium]
MKNHSKIVLFLCAFFFMMDSQAQEFNKKNRYSSIGANINAMNYVGELDPAPSIISPAFRYTRPNIGLCYIYRYGPRLSFRGNVSYGRIQGSDARNANYADRNIHRRIRNQDFRNDIFEVKADAIIDLFEHRGHYRRRVDYTPYVSIGVAYFYHNPQGTHPVTGEWLNLRPLSTEGQGLPGSDRGMYSLHQIAIPIGVGFRYKLSTNLDLAFEVGFRFTFTDYLDDVSGQYFDRNIIEQYRGENAALMADKSIFSLVDDPQMQQFVDERQGGTWTETTDQGNEYSSVNGFGRRGDKRGDPNRDLYIVTGFHLTYIIPGRVICPKFR